MHILRSTSVCALSVLVFSISACTTTSKRLAEDLHSAGFTISLPEDEEGATGQIVTVSDTESVERLAQWFRHRPRATDDQFTVFFVTEVFQPTLLGQTGFPGIVRIETTRLRVNLPLFTDLPVVLETRAKPTDEWSKSLWKARNEDMELQRWAIERFKTSMISQYRTEAANHALQSGQTIPD